jgi:hypothetical protein
VLDTSDGRFSDTEGLWDGKMVLRVPILVKWRTRRAIMAESWMLGILKPSVAAGGLENRKAGSGGSARGYCCRCEGVLRASTTAINAMHVKKCILEVQ